MKKEEIIKTLTELKNNKFLKMQEETNSTKWAKLSADFQRLMRCINQLTATEFSEEQNTSTLKAGKSEITLEENTSSMKNQ